MDNIIMHIDVNNAFLSWSAIDLLNHGYKIDIRNIESIIGGDEKMRHGIVLAKSMPAKRKGIKTALTLREAKRLCPNLKIYPPNYNWYQYMSSCLFKLISAYTPDIEILSIDECFIDYTKVKKLYGDPIKFAYKLKREIKNKLGFTVNIGIANNKLCAKMASDFLKPDRVHTLFMNEIKKKMYHLPIEELYGIGKSSSKKLRSLRINTIGDLANTDINYLNKYFKNQALKMINSAQGIDNSIVISEKPDATSISNSTTTNYNLTSIEGINKVLFSLTENVCVSLRNSNKYAYVVTVQLKDKFFKNYTHRRKLKNATNITSEIYNVAKILVKEMWNEESIRLVGISLSNLVVDNHHQISIFDDITKKDSNQKLDKVVDELKKNYGKDIINKASLINNKIGKKYN